MMGMPQGVGQEGVAQHSSGRLHPESNPMVGQLMAQAAMGVSPVNGKVLTHQALQPGQAAAVGPLRRCILPSSNWAAAGRMHHKVAMVDDVMRHIVESCSNCVDLKRKQVCLCNIYATGHPWISCKCCHPALLDSHC